MFSLKSSAVAFFISVQIIWMKSQPIKKLEDRWRVKSKILILPFLTNEYTQYLQKEPLFADQNTFNHPAKNYVAKTYGLQKKKLRIEVRSANLYQLEVIQSHLNTVDIFESKQINFKDIR